MQILRAAHRVPAPWKNGGGVTWEVAAWPPGSGLEDFGWRISIANVRRAGPFSVFEEIDRELAVIEGTLRLSIDGRDAACLGADSPPVRFPGDIPTSSEPLSGAVTDLNVMTRRGQFTSRMARLELRGSHSLGELTATRFVIALGRMTIAVDDAEHALDAHDAVHLGPHHRGTRLAARAATCILIDIFDAPGTRPTHSTFALPTGK